MHTMIRLLFVVLFSCHVLADGADVASLTAKAAGGDSEAQVELGKLYLSGDGVPQDPHQAFGWMSKAAAKGNASGQLALGVMYNKGVGVATDFNEAAKWYRLSAEQGNVVGQRMMGEAYDLGIGVEKNEDEAQKWYQRAAAQRDQEGAFRSKAYREKKEKEEKQRVTQEAQIKKETSPTAKASKAPEVTKEKQNSENIITTISGSIFNFMMVFLSVMLVMFWNSEVTFINPANGYKEKISRFTWLWTLLFAPIFFVIKGYWGHALISFLLFTPSFGMSAILYSLVSRSILVSGYRRKGWIKEGENPPRRRVRRTEHEEDDDEQYEDDEDDENVR
ncbi:MAG: sel1 repeat family protein [Magnetococcales bacterium]|nr:sel1 repeat family protein [Magnetococcales bacterium]